jgi:2-methylcitrate dehydratase PrpD
MGELFGASAAAGALTELDATRLRYLLSFTVQQASGIPSWARDQDHIEKAFDFGGMPARNGVASATMVEAGFTGVNDVFEGDWNFFRSFSQDADPEKLVADLGERFEIVNTNIKKYCVGSPIQAALDALFNITSEHPVSPRDVQKMVVTLGVTGARTVNDRNMPDINLQYILATTLIDGDLSFERAHDYDHMTDPAVMALRSKIELRGDNTLVTAESIRQAIVEIQTRDGRQLRDHVVKVRGTAENPMSAEEVENKARDLVQPILGRDKTERLIREMRSVLQK